MTLKVVSAALLLDDGFIFTQPPPARHHTLVREICRLTGKPFTNLDTQGFLLSDGKFCRRVAAASVALKAGQLDALGWPPNLYSEDLW